MTGYGSGQGRWVQGRTLPLPSQHLLGATVGNRYDEREPNRDGLPVVPRVLAGRAYKYHLGCGNVRVIITRESENSPILEVFCMTGKSGGCSLSFTQALGKTVSIALRNGVSPEQIIRMLSKVSCNNGGWEDGKRVESCSDAIACALKEDMERNKGVGVEAGAGNKKMTPEEEKEEEERAKEELERQKRERDEQGLR